MSARDDELHVMQLQGVGIRRSWEECAHAFSRVGMPAQQPRNRRLASFCWCSRLGRGRQRLHGEPCHGTPRGAAGRSGRMYWNTTTTPP
jgi:hypothetical protein